MPVSIPCGSVKRFAVSYENSAVELATIPVEDDGSPVAMCESSSDQYLNTCYPTFTGADALHAEGITGDGVTVAVLDSGLWNKSHLIDDSNGYRVLAQYDVNNPGDSYDGDIYDDSGHGSHVTSVIMSYGQTQEGYYNGAEIRAQVAERSKKREAI